MEMALALLLSAINKSTRNKIDARDPDMLGMLGGLLPFLIRAMRSRHGTVASTALRVFSVLVPLPLPGEPVARLSVVTDMREIGNLTHI